MIDDGMRVMRKNTVHKDDSGVSPVVEYIITFVVASIIFTTMLVISNGLFIEGPQKTVSQLQFTDVGNELSAKMIDTYIVAPKDGSVSTEFDMPSSIAGRSYFVNVQKSKNVWDKEIAVSSESGDVIMKVTLNGVNQTIPLTGKTSSHNTTHRIYYSTGS
jgi:hypothetical protein